jgi:hypothetical protein
MMTKLSWTLAALAALALAPPAAATTTPNGASAPSPAARPDGDPPPTARDLYIGCYLLLRDTDVPMGSDNKPTAYSAANCGSQVLSTMTYREGAQPGQPFRFCLPDNDESRDRPALMMAQAYVDYYERKSSRVPKDTKGSALFVVAMVDRWPCTAKAR